MVGALVSHVTWRAAVRIHRTDWTTYAAAVVSLAIVALAHPRSRASRIARGPDVRSDICRAFLERPYDGKSARVDITRLRPAV